MNETGQLHRKAGNHHHQEECLWWTWNAALGFSVSVSGMFLPCGESVQGCRGIREEAAMHSSCTVWATERETSSAQSTDCERVTKRGGSLDKHISLLGKCVLREARMTGQRGLMAVRAPICLMIGISSVPWKCGANTAASRCLWRWPRCPCHGNAGAITDPPHQAGHGLHY